MNKIEKIIINQKRQEWMNNQEAEFDTLFDGVKLDEDGNTTDEYFDAFNIWLSEMEQYTVTTVDEDDNEVTNTYSRKLRPMPRFSASKSDREEYNKTIYKELRTKEYPPIVDYVDAVVKNDTEAIEAYIEACLAVKAKYPKVMN